MKRRHFLKKIPYLPLLFNVPCEIYGNSLKEASYYVNENGKGKCQLCPVNCTISENQYGSCGVRKYQNGKLIAENYFRLAAMNIDPIEKKPFYHFMPGENTLSIAAPGCNLHCEFCQNWQISQSKVNEISTVMKTSEEINHICLKNNLKIIAYTYSEPTVYIETLMEQAKTAKRKNIKNICVSAGFINETPLQDLLTYLDAIKIDLKSNSDHFYQKYCGGNLKPVLKTIKNISRSGAWLEIVTLIIPGLNDNEDEIRNICQWIKNEIGAEVPLHFSRFYPNYKLKNYPPTPLNTLIRAYERAKEIGLKHVYVGNIRDHQYNSTYCSNCGELLIKRYGFIVTENKINKGKCPSCLNPVSGVWQMK